MVPLVNQRGARQPALEILKALIDCVATGHDTGVSETKRKQEIDAQIEGILELVNRRVERD